VEVVLARRTAVAVAIAVGRGGARRGSGVVRAALVTALAFAEVGADGVHAQSVDLAGILAGSGALVDVLVAQLSAVATLAVADAVAYGGVVFTLAINAAGTVRCANFAVGAVEPVLKVAEPRQALLAPGVTRVAAAVTARPSRRIARGRVPVAVVAAAAARGVTDSVLSGDASVAACALEVLSDAAIALTRGRITTVRACIPAIAITGVTRQPRGTAIVPHTAAARVRPCQVATCRLRGAIVQTLVAFIDILTGISVYQSIPRQRASALVAGKVFCRTPGSLLASGTVGAQRDVFALEKVLALLVAVVERHHHEARIAAALVTVVQVNAS